MVKGGVMIQIAYPWELITVFLPFLIYYTLPKANQQAANALRVPFFEQLYQAFSNENTPNNGNTKSKLKYLLVLIWILMVISGSGIQWLGKPIALPQTGRDLFMTIDLSGSMQTPDMVVNGQAQTRIDVVKQVASQFIDNRNGDRLGLVLFGSRAYLQTPLTFDRKTVAQMLNDATLGIAGPQTAIGDALGLGIKQLIDHPKNSKAIILLTDGGNNSGVMEPLAAAKLAAQEHIKIYTIGLGAEQIAVPGMFGNQIINPSKDLDVDSLKQIAQLTGGEFFRAEDAASLANIYAQINQLEPIKSAEITIRPITPFYPWSLGLALILSFILILIKLRRS